MLEKRSTIDACVADLEMAQKMVNHLSNEQGASEEQIRKAAIHAKRLEVKLAAAKVAHAEYYLSSLTARLDYIEARLAQGALLKRESDELAWIHEALPINSATVTRLAAELEQRKQELEALLNQTEMAGSAVY